MAYYIMYAPYDFDAIAANPPDCYVNEKGDHECVEFIRQTTGAPSTRNWRPGPKVRGRQDIPKGVAIATFQNGRYSKHAAIYLGQDELAIWVLDQWNSQGKVMKRPIRFPTGKEKREIKVQNNGDEYYVVDSQDTEAAARAKGEPAGARVI